MKLELVTLLGVKLDRDVYEVILPTLEGEISVFPGHESLVTIAVPGVIGVRYERTDPDNLLDDFAISGGVIEISGDKVRVLVDEAASGEDIVETESKAALERAMAMRENATSQVELEKAHQLVDRHAVRLKVAEIRRRRRRQ